MDVIRMITFAIVPNFASFQDSMITICEITTAVMEKMVQYSFFSMNNVAEVTNNKVAINHIMPTGFEMAMVNCFISTYRNAFAKPIK
ncbi:hypothetical protein SanaruYs_20010 [Chryseotalea sanaruensis]|uniref:Uncharacterized protein n=1 Tax=Chryseotalea sanaruensis TaxID=2482724 RepID=A0A401UA72_9BACT|nr:hypothetical protein SanaruYs_20010 [Chryseotalea sanaruensis]